MPASVPLRRKVLMHTENCYSGIAEVRAKVLRVDTEAGKLSLGLKPSYLEEDDADEADSEGDEEDDGEGRDLDELLAEELDAQQRCAAEVCLTPLARPHAGSSSPSAQVRLLVFCRSCFCARLGPFAPEGQCPEGP